MAGFARIGLPYRQQWMCMRYNGSYKHCGHYQLSYFMGIVRGMSVALRKGSETQDKAILEELNVPFSRASVGTFFQDHPRLGNQYLEDTFLQKYLRRHLPPKVFQEVSQQLERFGARVTDEIDSLGRECELSPPQLQQYDAWGQRVDRIVTCPAWKRMKEISAEEGLIAEAYERKYSSWSRVYQVAKMYLYAPSSGLFTCPLAMTDGAAKVIETLGMSGPIEEAYRHLTSRDPREFWTSGQWMTERKGGSDIASGTETVAREQPDGTFQLYGFKWFTSATDSDMTLTLGRIMDTQGATKQGTKGLSLFYLKIQNEDGKLNGIEVQKLKDKLGTRQVPTAELLLDRTKAFLVQIRGAFLLMMEVARLLGLEETNMATEQDRHILRLLTPLAKLYTGKQAISIVSEGLECFGGQGYMEDTGLPAMLRDAQVLTIWEGTTNILSLDVLRALAKNEGQMVSFFSAVQSNLESSLNIPELASSVTLAQVALNRLGEFTQRAGLKGATFLELAARDFAYSLARIYMGGLLLKHAAWIEASSADIYNAQRWCEQDLCPVHTADKAGAYNAETASMDTTLVYEGSLLLKGN
ncbi:acyl-CoA dehydrogenase family member 11-like isoform X3 [Rhinatrema bivittatum]|uniref:acyl-CoA dehydrogenase family member 11-like isoform X3 n=1 Tax=Rhinatrema bivittatum TaxID=194408 RepID=UPI00112CEEE3|nr:acyl-CoA dehydrogenase family member 11-like isoform X3 [Rhinatrema bivittatum]